MAFLLIFSMLFAKTAVAYVCDIIITPIEGSDPQTISINRAIENYKRDVEELIRANPDLDPRLLANACDDAKDNIARANNVADKAAEAKEKRENELSQQNRMLTGATMLATGLGGMQLAQGVAEQRSDQHGAETMDNYLASIRCGIGNNRDLKINESGTTPGRATEFGDAVMDAVTLAQRISNAKNHLGMQPGMEADMLSLIDTSMLYTGRGSNTDGVANKFDTARERLDSNSAQNRMIAGGAMAGAGVAGGIAGNDLINNEDTKLTKGAVAGITAGGGALGGVLGGAGATGSLGGGVKAVGSALGSLSDIRAKENLTPIGKLDNGLTIYSGSYRPETGLDTRPQLFLIAQEVMEVKPDAVSENTDGFLMVDYDKATK